jgi:Nucleotidyl transferase AbiEii toxin, Type IV TA system
MPRASFARTGCSGVVERKPRHRSGYSSEATLQVRAACLTMAVTLGAYLDDLCVVGGLVPSLLIDERSTVAEEARHPGTNDLDVALAVGLLDGERYAAVAERLRQEGFGADVNAKGNPAVQRWRLLDLNVTIDFLMAPLPHQDVGQRVQFLDRDLGAMVMPGLEMAFDERVDVHLSGRTLFGESVTRAVPVCGPAAFIALKALAFGDRGEPKDAYDLLYVLRAADGAPGSVADRLVTHSRRHGETVARALSLLARDFSSPEAVGPRRAGDFEVIDVADYDAVVADAHGHLDDLLTACRHRGLLAGS